MHNPKTTDLKMKKLTLIVIALIWVLSLIVLLVSLTDLYPINLFVENRFVIVILFISIAGALKPIYNSVINKDSNFIKI